MASTTIRRPLPALIALVALLLLTGLVWWRVLHRGTSSDAASVPCPTTAPQVTLPAPTSVTASVYNSTKRNGIAGNARRTLIQDGFQVPKPATNAPAKTKVKVTAQIRYGPRGKKGATLMRYYLPGATLVATKAKSATVYVILGTKYTRVASASAVKRSLAGDKIVIASSSPTPTPSGSATC